MSHDLGPEFPSFWAWGFLRTHPTARPQDSYCELAYISPVRAQTKPCGARVNRDDATCIGGLWWRALVSGPMVCSRLGQPLRRTPPGSTSIPWCSSHLATRRPHSSVAAVFATDAAS